jgi:SAM-dependent methyltransferase
MMTSIGTVPSPPTAAGHVKAPAGLRAPRRGVGERYLSTRLLAANAGLSDPRTQRDIAANIGPFLPVRRDALILDIGVGTGAVLDYLKVQGYTAYRGVDVDEECVQLCARAHPVELVSDAGAFLRSRASTFDAIVLRDVLPHLQAEDAVHLLSGALLALTPASPVIVQAFNGALPSASYTLANDLTHRVVYTEHSLRQLFLLAGFDDVHVHGAIQVTRGFRGMAYRAARRAYCHALTLTIGLERGFGGNPTIYERELVAVGRAPRQ